MVRGDILSTKTITVQSQIPRYQIAMKIVILQRHCLHMCTLCRGQPPLPTLFLVTIKMSSSLNSEAYVSSHFDDAVGRSCNSGKNRWGGLKSIRSRFRGGNQSSGNLVSLSLSTTPAHTCSMILSEASLVCSSPTDPVCMWMRLAKLNSSLSQ